MDKKLFRAMAAAFVLAAVSVSGGCEDKEKPEPVPSESETVGDYREENSLSHEKPAVREYSEDDFKDVALSLTIVDKEAPVEISTVDISGFDFGEKVPLCNKEEFAEDYYTDKRESFIDNVAYNWKEFVDVPVRGIPCKCFIWNGKCYIFVIYEQFHVYDWSLFSCDLSGGNMTEVYNWSARDTAEYCDINVCFSEGGMFFTRYRNDNNRLVPDVFRVDLETAVETALYEGTGKDAGIWLFADESGTVNLQEFSNIGDKGTTVYRYDSGKGEFVKDEEITAPEGQIMSSDCFNGVYSYLIKPEGKRKYDLVNEYYHMKTALTTGRIVYADEKLAVLFNNIKLHIYNLEKMEHCIIDIQDMGTAMTMSGGKLFIGSNGNRVKTPVYCVIPELGITYPIVDAGIYSDITPTADGITFNETSTDIHKITGYITDENGEVHKGGYSHEYDRIDKLYTVKLK